VRILERRKGEERRREDAPQPDPAVRLDALPRRVVARRDKVPRAHLHRLDVGAVPAPGAPRRPVRDGEVVVVGCGGGRGDWTCGCAGGGGGRGGAERGGARHGRDGRRRGARRRRGRRAGCARRRRRARRGRTCCRLGPRLLLPETHVARAPREQDALARARQVAEPACRAALVGRSSARAVLELALLALLLDAVERLALGEGVGEGFGCWGGRKRVSERAERTEREEGEVDARTADMWSTNWLSRLGASRSSSLSLGLKERARTGLANKAGGAGRESEARSAGSDLRFLPARVGGARQ